MFALELAGTATHAIADTTRRKETPTMYDQKSRGNPHQRCGLQQRKKVSASTGSALRTVSRSKGNKYTWARWCKGRHCMDYKPQTKAGTGCKPKAAELVRHLDSGLSQRNHWRFSHGRSDGRRCWPSGPALRVHQWPQAKNPLKPESIETRIH